MADVDVAGSGTTWMLPSRTRLKYFWFRTDSPCASAYTSWEMSCSLLFSCCYFMEDWVQIISFLKSGDLNATEMVLYPGLKTVILLI